MRLDPFIATHPIDIDTLITSIAGDVRGGDVVVDIGSGDGAIIQRLREQLGTISIIGLECEAALVQSARSRFADDARVSIRQCDAMAVSWAEFDVLVMSVTRDHALTVLEKFERELEAASRPRLLALFIGAFVWMIRRVAVTPPQLW